MTIINIMDMNREQPETIEGLQVGAVITYNDRANNSRGLIYEVGSMVKVAWTDKPGLSEVAANGIKYGWQLTGEIRPLDEAFAARDIAIQARAQKIQNSEQQRQERDAKTEQGRKILETLMPVGTKAAIIAEYQEDDCDTQTDYFNVKTTRTVLLGFSTHTKDLFSEMRKVAKASGFSEVQHLTEPNKEQEHREKYSMGRGYYLKDSLTYSTGWVIEKQNLAIYGLDKIALAIMEEGGNQLPSAEPEPPTKPPTTPHQENTDCTLRENPDKNGIELIFGEKPSAEIRDRMKGAGFRWHGRNGYWYAKDNDQTRGLAEQLAGGEPPTVEQKAENVATTERANGDRLRTLADAMTKQIDAKFDPGVSHQNPTARRARIAESMRQDGEALQKVQSVLYGLADDIEAGTLPEYLTGIKSKAVITEILQSEARRVYYPESWRFYDDDGRLKKAGVTASNFAEVAAQLMAYIKPPTEAEVKDKTIAELERDLIGVKIDGFFPTPSPVIDQMLIKAGIEEGNSILEPSAGKGDIADAIRKQHPDNFLRVIEVNYTLCQILKAKGHIMSGTDFLEEAGFEFDRILINPPFEKMADIDHIKHAYKSLKNGGRLVCLMSEGPFFRSDRKAVEFRGWLDEVGGWSEKLEEGSFKGAESFRQTGVNMRMVIIDK